MNLQKLNRYCSPIPSCYTIAIATQIHCNMAHVTEIDNTALYCLVYIIELARAFFSILSKKEGQMFFRFLLLMWDERQYSFTVLPQGSVNYPTLWHISPRSSTFTWPRTQRAEGVSSLYLQDDKEKKEQWSCQNGPWPHAAYLLHELCPMRAQGQGH